MPAACNGGCSRATTAPNASAKLSKSLTPHVRRPDSKSSQMANARTHSNISICHLTIITGMCMNVLTNRRGRPMLTAMTMIGSFWRTLLMSI